MSEKRKASFINIETPNKGVAMLDVDSITSLEIRSWAVCIVCGGREFFLRLDDKSESELLRVYQSTRRTWIAARGLNP